MRFPQVVWKGTRKVGCGIKRGCRGRYDYILTCQYYFFGNVGGGYMSNVLPVSKTSQQCRAECGAPQRTGWDFSGCATHFPGVCNVKCAWGYWGSPMAFCQSTGQWRCVRPRQSAGDRPFGGRRRGGRACSAWALLCGLGRGGRLRI